MKLKNLKIYLLAIFSIFLFNLTTFAVDFNIEKPFPSIFFKKASEPGNKKIIIETIKGLLDDPNYTSEDIDSKKYLSTAFTNMRRHLDKTNITDYITYIDTTKNKISQCVYIKYDRQQPIPVFLHSTYKPTMIKFKNEFPEAFFNSIKNPDTNKKLLLNKFKEASPKNKGNIFDALIEDANNVYFEETLTYDLEKNKNQCVLTSHNSDFFFFCFQSSIKN